MQPPTLYQEWHQHVRIQEGSSAGQALPNYEVVAQVSYVRAQVLVCTCSLPPPQSYDPPLILTYTVSLPVFLPLPLPSLYLPTVSLLLYLLDVCTLCLMITYTNSPLTC